MALRKIPIRRAGNRPALFMGGDREMVMSSGLLAAVLVFANPSLFTFLAGFALWIGSLMACRLMAKADPKMRQVYMRHRRYAVYYSARSTPHRENPPSQARQWG